MLYNMKGINQASKTTLELRSQGAIHLPAHSVCYSVFMSRDHD